MTPQEVLAWVRVVAESAILLGIAVAAVIGLVRMAWGK